jgi:hypothetical protein
MNQCGRKSLPPHTGIGKDPKTTFNTAGMLPDDI